MAELALSGFLMCSAIVLLACQFLQVHSKKTNSLLFGLLNTVSSVFLKITHENFMSAFHASLAAVFFWLWWISGGNDDTKRRIRSTLKKFSPVRRTAPVTS